MNGSLARIVAWTATILLWGMGANATVFAQQTYDRPSALDLAELHPEARAYNQGTQSQQRGDVSGDASGAAPGGSDSPDAANAAKDAEAAKKKKEKVKKLKEQSAKAYRPVFYDNDFAYLLDPDYDTWFIGENLKQTCLAGICFDFGGQYRFRFQNEINMRGLGLTGVDDRFGLHRTRLFANARIGPRLRVFGEFMDADSNNEDFAPRPIDVNRADALNLFADAELLRIDDNSLSVRIGRQELLYGAQRLISPLDWANTRRTFEGAKVMLAGEGWSIDAFWTNPIRIDDRSFDSPDRDQEFMGIWSSFKGRENTVTDFYNLRYINGRGTNDFKFNTMGFRRKGNLKKIQYELQAAYQYGTNTNGSDHSAGMTTFGLGKSFADRGWKPSIWLYYDWASGDNALGAGNGYHQQFPLAHKYLGFMDLFGRRNIEDFNLLVTMQPTKRLKLLAWYHYLFLATQSDSPYSVVMTPFNGTNLPASNNLGQEIDLLGTYTISPRQNLVLGYSHFFSGSYYSLTPGTPFAGDGNFFYTQYTINL